MVLNEHRIPLIASYTDFGPGGPYQGQMAAVIATRAPGIPQVTLMADAPMFDPQCAGILLACLCRNLPPRTLVLAVVDPGVGGDRRPIMIKSESLFLIGPDNGLLAPVVRRLARCDIEVIEWRPQRLSDSFHGRDLFAPVAARLAMGEEVAGLPLEPRELVGYDPPTDNRRIIYIDSYGNAMTGIDGEDVGDDRFFSVNGTKLRYARTFSEVAKGRAFWYRNANGLVEFAVNCGSASRQLGLEPGMKVRL